MPNEIIFLSPIIKEYIWGNERWLFSSEHEELDRAPFLIKEIESREALSIQVHPPDDYALKEEGSNGKTEMWYILDCQPDSWLYYGLKHRVSPEEIYKRSGNGTLPEICRKVPVNKGEVFFIPAGIIHAIGPGIRLLEVQQNSALTYRIYDYNRKTTDNQPRQLHTVKAVQVSHPLPVFFGHEPITAQIEEDGCTRTLLSQCPYFKVILYEVEQKLTFSHEPPLALLILKGEGKLYSDELVLTLQAGQTLAFPSDFKQCCITGKMTLVAVYP
ncbi:MAG: class I mannose-6-phosphate isomerase [Lachnospiraceae bacterium]